ncbi:MAG: AraC family transcriptional regulator [Venatoribacter sp.]
MARKFVPRPFIDAPLRGAAKRGIHKSELLEKSGIAIHALDDPEIGLSYSDYTRLLVRLWQLCNDEFMGLAAVNSPYGTFAMMSKALISCSNLEHALHRAQRFYQLFPGSPNICITRTNKIAKLEIIQDLSYDPDHFLSESLLVIWHRFASWLTGQGIPLLSVGCCYPAPAHAHLYQELFATPVHFNEKSTYLLMPSKALSLPINQTPATLRSFLQHSPADVLARPNPHESVTGKVRQLFHRYQLNALPDLNETAELLDISSATLRRHLAEENTSFQRLKDEYRMDEACLMLSQPEASIKDIAESLGFTETSTFHRAFRKWKGVTPGEFREKLS